MSPWLDRSLSSGGYILPEDMLAGGTYINSLLAALFSRVWKNLTGGG